MDHRKIMLVAGVLLLAIAFFVTPYVDRPALPYDLLLFGLTAPAGWVLAFAGLGRWRIGLATYFGLGLLTLAISAIQQGPDAYPNLRNIDASFWITYVPITCWPRVVLWMVGLGL